MCYRNCDMFFFLSVKFKRTLYNIKHENVVMPQIYIKTGGQCSELLINEAAPGFHTDAQRIADQSHRALLGHSVFVSDQHLDIDW